MEIAVLICALLSYNNLLNLWPPFTGALYLPINLSFGAVLVLIALGPLGLHARNLGLTGDHPAGVLLGVGIGLALVAPLLAAATSPRSAPLLADERVEGLSGASLAYQVLVRIPLGTAAFEELAFRGVLLAALSRHGLHATMISSLVFGLSHIGPTLNLIRANRPNASRRASLLTIGIAVVLTTGAGMLLAWLRQASGTLAAPIALHATVNSLATLAAVLARRRSCGARSH